MNKSNLTISHEEATIRSFGDDPAFAVEYLNACLADGDQEEIMLALRRVATAFKMRDIAEKAELNKNTLYRTLSSKGNPELKSLIPLLNAIGLRLAVVPI